jgi:alkanesulfonate monooxygenase
LPTLAAQLAATYQAMSDGRLYVNVVTGSNSAEQRGYGDPLDKARRYERTAEFLAVLRGCWQGAPFTFSGAYYNVDGGGLAAPLATQPLIFFGGSSESAAPVGAQYADVQLIYGETPPMAAEFIARLSEVAAAHNRSLRFGIRQHVIARPTTAEAWREADRLLDAMSETDIRRQQSMMSSRDSAGQQRILSLHSGSKADRDSLKIYPTVWAGSALVLPGGGTSLVGSYEEVAERLGEYRRIGIEHFILSGSPLLEEAYRFGECVLPLVRQDEERSARASQPGADTHAKRAIQEKTVA